MGKRELRDTLIKVAMSNLPTGAFICDREGVVQFINAAYAKYLGLRPEEAIGRHITELIPTSGIPAVLRSRKAELRQIRRFPNGGATLIVKRVKGIRRAAMGPAMPNKKGGNTVICDCGANAECTPEFLLQFGLVGSAYAKKKYGIENPRVGLLNIGTEDSKGTQLQRDAYALLADASQKGLLNFVGNVEARGVPLGDVDVVVCDGFSGNVLLKSIEGTAMFVGSLMKRMFKKNVFSKLGYLLCSSGVKQMMKLLDYHEIGGTQLLGIKKPVIKAHGASDRLAFRNAVKQAMDAAENDITQDLEQALALLAQSKEQTND